MGRTGRAAELIERLGVVRQAERRAAAAAAGLSSAQLEALTYLGACNRYSDTPAAVAEYLDATRGTTSQSLLALERKGLVIRTADARDGRVHHLAPTAAGRDLLAATDGGDIAAAVAALAGPDQERLATLLEDVLRTAQRARGGRPLGHCGDCRHLQRVAAARRCGLTGEPLSGHDTTLICVEHEPLAV